MKENKCYFSDTLNEFLCRTQGFAPSRYLQQKECEFCVEDDEHEQCAHYNVGVYISSCQNADAHREVEALEKLEEL